MARKAEQGALQYAASVTEVNPPRIGGAGFISGVFNDFLANPRLPFNRLTPIGRWLGYFWDSKVAPLALNFADGTDTLDSRITFSRSSNATVTDSNGNIVYAPHNLLTFSEQFDNSAWTKTNATVSANSIAAPDGTITADRIDYSAASTTPSVSIASQQSTYTISAYVKRNNTNFCRIRVGSVAGGSATSFGTFFNIVTGTVSANGTATADFGSISSAITDAGDGWYRISATFTVLNATSSINYGIIAAQTSGGGTTAGDSIYIWGAQLNQGSLQPYYPTTVKNLLGFSEAFENAVWTKSNSFIQTNLLTFSEQFGNAAWVKDANSVLTSNVAVAPNGSTTADKHAVGTSTFPQLAQTITATVNLTYNFTIYVKADGLNFIQLRVRNQATPANFFRAIFNLTTGEVTQIAGGGTGTITSSSATDVGNGWYRCSIAGIADTTGTSLQVVTILTKDSAGTVATSSNSAATDGVLMWGAQLVQGASAGDYVQTTSAALPVMYQAPNGTMTADKFVENTATSSHVIQPASSPSLTAGQIVTYSIYAKAAERSFIQLIHTGIGPASGNFIAGFDLSNGTAGTPTSGSTSTITPVGNGWYRCAITATAITTASSTAQIRISQNSTSSPSSYTGDGTSGIYIWGAQLSDSASLDPYVNNPVAAPSSTAFYGARFDYDPVTRQPRGLLIEESRANLLLQSEDFTTASWVNENSSETSNVTTAPSGQITADKLIENTANSAHSIYQAVSGIADNTVCISSFYAKASERSRVLVAIMDKSATTRGMVFDLVSGTVSSFNSLGITDTSFSGIQNVGNGWYKCWVGHSVGTGAFNPRAWIFLHNGTTISYTGDGSSGAFVWGAQLEAGSFPTSYIPTTTATVTRASDVAVIQGTNFSSWYKYDEGTLSVNAISLRPSSDTTRIAAISDGTANNSIRVNAATSSLSVVTGGSTEASFNLALNANLTNKYAIAYKVNDTNGVVNGVLGTTDTSVVLPTVNQLEIGRLASGTSGSILVGTIRSINYYNRRLDNSQLQAITQ